MKIREIWFDADYIYGRDEEGREYKQSLLWYPRLRQANDEERGNYFLGFDGIHSNMMMLSQAFCSDSS